MVNLIIILVELFAINAPILIQLSNEYVTSEIYNCFRKLYLLENSFTKLRRLFYLELSLNKMHERHTGQITSHILFRLQISKCSIHYANLSRS
jgi:hypothetical protein